MNNCTFGGRLTKKPVFDEKKGLTRLRLALDRGYSKEKRKELEEKGEPTADFPSITVFGKQGKACAEHLDKGSIVTIRASYRTNRVANGKGDYDYYEGLVADKVEFL